MNMHQPVDSSFKSSVSRSWASADDGGRRRLLIVAAVLVAAAVAAWLFFGGGADAPAENPPSRFEATSWRKPRSSTGYPRLEV